MTKTYKYTAIFDPNKEGGYTVTVPALPGLVTEGDTIKEARAMAKDAVQCYIESLAKDSMPIPPDSPIQPRSGVTVGKIVITPYRIERSMPVGISDLELSVKLWLMNQCLDVLFNERSSKKERIKSLRDLYTVCDNQLRKLIDQEIAQASKPGPKRKVVPKSLSKLQAAAKKRGLSTMTDQEIDREVRRIRKKLAHNG